MYKYYFSLPFLLFMGFLQTNWEPFISIEGKFSISAPGIFEEKINEAETKIGKLEYHTFFYQSEEDADNLWNDDGYQDDGYRDPYARPPGALDGGSGGGFGAPPPQSSPQDGGGGFFGGQRYLEIQDDLFTNYRLKNEKGRKVTLPLYVNLLNMQF